MGSFRNSRPLPLDETSFYDAILGAVDDSTLITDPRFGSEDDVGGLYALLFGPSAPAQLAAEAWYGDEAQWLGNTEVDFEVLPVQSLRVQSFENLSAVFGEDITVASGRVNVPIDAESSVTGWPVLIADFLFGFLDDETEGSAVYPTAVRTIWQSGANPSRGVSGLPQLIVNIDAVTPTVASTRRITVGATTYEVVGVFGVIPS